MKLLLVPCVTLLSSVLLQMPAKPPMKMGLWESTTTMTMKMPDMPNMPNMGAPRTTKVRSCMTPENYAKNFTSSQAQRKDCTRSNEVWTGSKYSADISCPSMNSKAHIEMNLTGMEAGHGAMHMDMNPSGHPMTMDMTIDTHFVSADCGSVSPDKPEILK